MDKRPHITRESIWEYVFAIPNIRHFVGADDDVNSVAGLALVEHVPKLILAATHDIKHDQDIEAFFEQHAVTLQTLKDKVLAAIAAENLPVYDDAHFLRVDRNEFRVYLGGYLVRFDDLEIWCLSQGLHIPSAFPEAGCEPIKEREISGKSEAAYLNILGSLCDLYWKAVHPDNSKINQAALIEALSSYRGFAGMSERNLKDKLSKAIKAICFE
jgi:hypothetical protein